MNFIEWLKVILLGIVEGITEWLPISSTGHLILTDAIWPLQQSDAFKGMFNVVIQLGAILAVVVLYWSKLWPSTVSASRSARGSPSRARTASWAACSASATAIAVWTRSSCG